MKKKMKLIGRCLLITLIFTPLIQSCDFLDDNNSLYPNADKVTIATITALSEDEDNDEFYFLIGGGKKLYPGNINNISRNYEWKDGQRAFVYFDLLNEKVSGYDYNGKIIYIENILTKNVIDMDETTADSIGNDKANIRFAWYGGEHINIEFEFLGTRNPQKLHMVNLVRNEMNDIQEEDDYLILEFRHNAHKDYEVERLIGIASFRPPFGKDETKTYKGVKIINNSIYEGIKTRTIDFDKEESRVYQGTLTELD